MTGRPCRAYHRGPFVQLAPNLTHCRACAATWTHARGVQPPTGRKPELTTPQAMRRTFWVTLLGGLLVWAILAIMALTAPP